MKRLGSQNLQVEGYTNLDGISDNGMKNTGTKYQRRIEFYNNIMSAGTKN